MLDTASPAASEFDNGWRTPVVFYDRYGRPVIIDADPEVRGLYLAGEDESLVRIVNDQSTDPAEDPDVVQLDAGPPV